jgi:hypothetical protein
VSGLAVSICSFLQPNSVKIDTVTMNIFFMIDFFNYP